MPAKVNASSQHIFDLLKVLSEAPRPMGVRDLSQKLGLPPSTTHRGLMTLLSAGYVARYQSSATYIIGESARRLRQSFFMRQRIRAVSQPYLQQLAFMTGESTSLTMRVGWYAVRIQMIAGTNEIVSIPIIGTVHALDSGVSAMTILAHLPPPVVARFLDSRPAMTASAREHLAGELREITARGYLSQVELHQSGGTMTFPVRHSGQAIASVTIHGAVYDRTTEEKAEVARLQAVVAEIEEAAAREPFEAICPFGSLDPDSIQLSLRGDAD